MARSSLVFLFFIIFGIGEIRSWSAEVPNSSSIRELARSQRWLRLLHYKPHFFSGIHSSVDAQSFFFSPDGSKNPESEMLATLQAFYQNAPRDISKLPQPPACAFPARFRFLNEELRLGLKAPDCNRWEEFLARFQGHDSVTLVFSTAYPNNPASMFGHSFLRINARAKSEQAKSDLLAYGISYAAQVPEDENNFLFLWYGLSGGYPGTFSSMPYYAKVQEYNQSENRDLWEYDLSLSSDETWWLLANVWELEVNGYSQYFFLDENCSYEILALLEVAKPKWSLTDYFLHVIPGETIKKVAQIPGAVRGVKFRPSLFRKLVAYGDRLNQRERESYSQLVRGQGIEDASVSVLETAAQYFHYLKQQRGGALPTAEAKLFQSVLMERSRRGIPAGEEPFFGEDSRPDLGHHAQRIAIGPGIQKGSESRYGWFQEFSFKFAYHDLLNHDPGFVPFSEINFPNVAFRYFPDEKRFWLQRLELLSIYSLSPWSWLKNSLSWNANIAYEVPQDLCAFCHLLHLHGSVGVSQPIAKDQLRIYELLGLSIDAGRELERGWRLGPKMTVGVLANLTKNWKQHLEATLNTDPWRLGSREFARVSLNLGQSYFFSPAWELRWIGRLNLPAFAEGARRGEGLLQADYYF